MATPFLGEVKIISFNFPPKGWAFCNGQVMSIPQNTALFALLGTTYGGDGIRTFALPNLQGATPLHMGGGFVLGQPGGEQTHTLSTAEMPAHTHIPSGSTSGVSSDTPANNVWCNNGGQSYSASSNTTMSPSDIAPAGGGQPHQNLSPFLVLNMIIALSGIFPTQN